MQKLRDIAAGTNNVDNCFALLPVSGDGQGFNRTVGCGGDSGSITDMEKADLVLIIGSNTAESHPVIATRVKSSHKLDGQKLIVSDLREHEMWAWQEQICSCSSFYGLICLWINAVSRYPLDNSRSGH